MSYSSEKEKKKKKGSQESPRMISKGKDLTNVPTKPNIQFTVTW